MFIPVTCTVAVSTGRTRCLSTNNRCPECFGPFLHPRSQCQNLGLVYSILIIKLSLLPPVSFLYHCDVCKHQQPCIFSCTLMSTYTQFKFFPSLSFYFTLSTLTSPLHSLSPSSLPLLHTHPPPHTHTHSLSLTHTVLGPSIAPPPDQFQICCC